MEMETGKLFIGGISWDTSEERLREYFQTFGEVVEAVIMKDRTTGRARGFGFVVFASAAVAEKVVRERHVIDGRTVEAKKAVPRDDHQNFNRNNSSSSIQGSPGPTRTKKIFVGGLASTVTESDFKTYFEQFGAITDTVVMYDHNTQRPRGFGFITFDSEEAVDKVLFKTFHELNGKMVEVKRAVPKELSPSPAKSPSPGFNYGLNRVANFASLLNSNYSPGYNSSPSNGYGLRMDSPSRFSPVSRSGYPPYSPFSYNMGLNLESALNLNYETGRDSGLGYGNGLGSYYDNNAGNPNRYNNNNPIGFETSASFLNNPNRSVWENSVASNAFVGSGNGNGNGSIGDFGSVGKMWGGSTRVSNPIGRDNIENNFNGRAPGYMRNNRPGSGSFSSATNDDGPFGEFYGGESFYGNNALRSGSPELETSGFFGYGPATTSTDGPPNGSVGYVGGYSVTDRSDRGIAA